jgi:glucokinase
MSDGIVLGIDVGGTKLAGMASGGDAPVVRTEPRDDSPIDRQVVELARRLLAAASGSATAVGIATPGRVDVDAGVVDLAVNVGAEAVALGAAVETAVGAPAFVEHDARAVARLLAAEGGHSDVAYLSVGTGISAGVVVDGVPLAGARGLAGEIGHQLADPNGPVCACGLIGCLEAIASGPAIARAAMTGRVAGNGAEITTTADVYRRADAGDPDATAIVDRAARHLAAAVRGLVLAFGVTHVVVGGGVTHAGSPFERPLRRHLAAEREASILVDRALAGTTVAILGDDPLVGARAATLVARQGRVGGPRAAAPPGEEVGHR